MSDIFNASNKSTNANIPFHAIFLNYNNNNIIDDSKLHTILALFKIEQTSLIFEILALGLNIADNGRVFLI